MTTVAARCSTRAMELQQLVQDLAAQRRRTPDDDLTSALVNANIDGEQLTAAGARLVLHPAGRRGQRDHPQRHLVRHAPAHREPRPARAAGRTTSTAVTPSAVEEIVRLASPVTFMRRTVTQRPRAERPRSTARARRSSCSTAPPTATRASSTTRALRRHAATRTRTSASAARARTSASAPTWPAARSPVMFRELLRRVPDIEAGEPGTALLQLHQRHQAHEMRVLSHSRPPAPGWKAGCRNPRLSKPGRTSRGRRLDRLEDRVDVGQQLLLLSGTDM